MPRLRQGLLAGILSSFLLVVLAVQAGAQTGAEPAPPADPQTPAPASAPPGVAAEDGQGGDRPAPELRLESVRVEPAGGDAELLVRRNLPLRTGQKIDSQTLLQAREHLLSTGLFKEVDLYTMRGSRPGAVTAVVAAEPSRRFHLETGLGHDPLRGWYLNIISLRRTGLFDRGGTARIDFRSGLRASGLYGELEVPELLAHETDLLVNLGTFDETWNIHQGDSTHYQQIGRAQIQVGARRRLRGDVSALVWAGYSGAHPSATLEHFDDDPVIPAARLVPVIEDLHFGELRAELVRDRQDRLRPWQNGSWAGFILHAGLPDRGEVFHGGEFDVRSARPVLGTRAAAFRFRAAYASPDTPYFLRPIAGGVGSLRGFPPASLSGPHGARALCQLSAEWRHPLAGSDPRQPRVIGTLFAEVGEHWSSNGRRADPAASVGYGALFRVRWLQTLNLEIAYPLTDQVKESPVAIHLSLGRSF